MNLDNHKVAKFIFDEMNSSLSNVLLLKDESENEYFLFNRYFIKEVSRGCFEVIFLYNDEKTIFNSLKNAVCFCIFDKANKFNETKNIKQLDLSLASIEVSIGQLKKLVKKTKDTSLKLIYIAKLNEEILRKKRMKQQLLGYLLKAQHYQLTKYKVSYPNN